MNKQLALDNGVRKYGEELAGKRALVAVRMRAARKTFPADLIMNIHRVPGFIRAERKAMRAYALTLR